MGKSDKFQKSLAKGYPTRVVLIQKRPSINYPHDKQYIDMPSGIHPHAVGFVAKLYIGW